MNAIIVYPEIEAFGGEERVLLGLCDQLDAMGVRTTVVSYFDRIGLSTYAKSRINQIVLEPSGGFYSKAQSLKKALADQQVSGGVLMFGLQAAAHAEAARLDNYVVRIADTPSLLHTPAMPWARRQVAKLKAALFLGLAGRGLRRASSVVVNANYLGDELRRLYRVEPTTIYIGIVRPADDTRPGPIDDRSEISILSVSRLEPNKRIDWLIRAAAECDDVSDVPVFLDIVGDGSERQSLQMLSQSLGSADRVRFHGFVTDERLEHMYRQADVFAMPAVQGFGLPALEALARDLPVVMHRDSGVSEILNDTLWARLFDGDADSLRDALLSMLEVRKQGRLGSEAKPYVPTDEEFARAIATHCGWL